MQRFAIVLAVVSLTGAAHADIPIKSAYVGAHVGGHVVTGNWDLYKIGNGRVTGSSGAQIGLRGGLHATWWLAGEFGLSLLPTSAGDDDSSTAMSWTFDALFHVMKGDWVPMVDVGAGFYHSFSGELGDDADYHIHYGIGLRGMLTKWLALRVDARHILTDGWGDDPRIASNLELNVGVDFYVWEEDHTPPDTDKDGIADVQDKCPKKPGVASGQGCPDADGDGIVDSKDRCKLVKGQAKFQGCKDTDGDGVGDPDDKCVDSKGPADNEGCPRDTDKDGIIDREDRCPKQKGPKQHKGCPDRDGDGIADVDDKCPTIKGVKEEQGCLPKAVAEKFSGTFEGIYFKTGSAKIRKKSFPILDEAIILLGEWPELRVRIEGHTDDRGRDEKNLKLSQERADAVKAYFVEHGLKADRFESIGYGETKPIGDNKTRDGRAANRRIEINVIAD